MAKTLNKENLFLIVVITGLIDFFFSFVSQNRERVVLALCPSRFPRESLSCFFLCFFSLKGSNQSSSFFPSKNFKRIFIVRCSLNTFSRASKTSFFAYFKLRHNIVVFVLKIVVKYLIFKVNKQIHTSSTTDLPSLLFATYKIYFYIKRIVDKPDKDIEFFGGFYYMQKQQKPLWTLGYGQHN